MTHASVQRICKEILSFLHVSVCQVSTILKMCFQFNAASTVGTYLPFQQYLLMYRYRNTAVTMYVINNFTVS